MWVNFVIADKKKSWREAGFNTWLLNIFQPSILLTMWNVCRNLGHCNFAFSKELRELQQLNSRVSKIFLTISRVCSSGQSWTWGLRTNFWLFTIKACSFSSHWKIACSQPKTSKRIINFMGFLYLLIAVLWLILHSWSAWATIFWYCAFFLVCSCFWCQLMRVTWNWSLKILKCHIICYSSL